jgi:hypothetical protein
LLQVFRERMFSNKTVIEKLWPGKELQEIEEWPKGVPKHAFAQARAITLYGIDDLERLYDMVKQQAEHVQPNREKLRAIQFSIHHHVATWAQERSLSRKRARDGSSFVR